MDLIDLRRRLRGWTHYPEIVAITIAVVAVPMVAGWAPPNSYFGFRTPATFASLEEWYRANRMMGCYMVASQLVALGSMSAVAGAMMSRFGSNRVTWGVLWSCFLALLGIAAAVVHYYR